MVKKISKIIKNVILLIRLKQYKTLVRKFTLQYKLHSWRQAKKKHLIIKRLLKYKNLFNDGVHLAVKDEDISFLFNQLSLNINADAKILFTDDVSLITRHYQLVVFLDLTKNESLASLRSKNIDFILTNSLNKYSNLDNDKVYYYDEEVKKFCIGRFLLSIDFITFDLFMQYCDELNPFKSTSNVCLTLPEYSGRFKYINNLISSPELSYFKFSQTIGLRHMISWIGCGLSYKYLFNKALQANLANLTIAEDDVFLEEGFFENYKKIRDYLLTNPDWDVFNGYTFWADGSRVQPLISFENISLYNTNKFISMVFNCYNRSLIEKGSMWDDSCRNLENAIDGYLSSHASSVIVSMPFIVGHNDELDSVLWGNNNEFIYANMVSESNMIAKSVCEK